MISYGLVRGSILKEHGSYVPVSDLVRVQSCPVRYYYERNDSMNESDKYAICKQISYHLGNALDYEIIWNEVRAVHPDINPDLRPYLETCIAACSKNVWKPATQTDVRVISEKHGIVAMVDRIADEGTYSIIRAAGAMPFGTYVSDRLRIASIAFCMEEMTGTEVSGGNVEYIPDGISRFHTVQPRDRRQVITSLHKIRAIQNGELPKQPLNAPCNRCKHKERCESTSGHRLSDLM